MDKFLIKTRLMARVCFMCFTTLLLVRGLPLMSNITCFYSEHLAGVMLGYFTFWNVEVSGSVLFLQRLKLLQWTVITQETGKKSLCPQSVLLNNCWMRLSMISWIIKAKVCVICRSWRLRQITQTRGFGNLWYHANTEFNNNCFIIHFSHNSSEHSAILFLRRTLQGA